MSADALEAFGLAPDLASIYRYAPVYRAGDRVLKRSKRGDEAYGGLVAWQKTVNERARLLVEPLGKSRIVADERWVMYPFVEGDEYECSEGSIAAAGRLLGKIHEASDSAPILRNGHNWDRVVATKGELADDLAYVEGRYAERVSANHLRALGERIRWFEGLGRESWRPEELPSCGGVWDFKANNLIYTQEGPVLIDSDNAGHIPRTMDLALALLLFHMEMHTAPPRMFTPSEWRIFMQGYAESIRLTQVEVQQWEEMLAYVYIDEVLWAIVDLDEGESDRQKAFIEAMVGVDLSGYGLVP